MDIEASSVGAVLFSTALAGFVSFNNLNSYLSPVSTKSISYSTPPMRTVFPNVVVYAASYRTKLSSILNCRRKRSKLSSTRNTDSDCPFPLVFGLAFARTAAFSGSWVKSNSANRTRLCLSFGLPPFRVAGLRAECVCGAFSCSIFWSVEGYATMRTYVRYRTLKGICCALTAAMVNLGVICLKILTTLEANFAHY